MLPEQGDQYRLTESGEAGHPLTDEGLAGAPTTMLSPQPDGS